MEALSGAGGAAGWVGAGLLGLVLYWLLAKHLPAKDKQLSEFIMAKDTLITGAVESARRDFLGALTQQRDDFTSNLERILVFNERQISGMTTILHRDMEAMNTSVGELRRAVDVLVERLEDRRLKNEDVDIDRRKKDSTRGTN